MNFKERFPKFKKHVAQALIGLMLVAGPAVAYNSGDLPVGSNIGGHLVATVANKLSDFASTTSAQLASVISDHTGSGLLYFTGGALGTPASGNPVNLTGSAPGMNAGTATALQTPRTINGVAFDGTANITPPAPAGTLTGGTLASSVTASSLTSVGTLANLTVTNPINGSVTGEAGSVAASALTGTTLASNVVTSSLTSVGTLGGLSVTAPIAGSVTGNAATATALQTGRAINGVNFDGTAPITVAAAAGTLSGGSLAAGVTGSSLTGLGTIATGTWQGTPIADGFIASATTWNAKQAALPAGTTTTVLHGNASGSPTYGAVATADMAAGTANSLLGYGGAGAASGVTVGSGLALSGGTLTSTGSGGTVTSASVVSANGLAGTVATATTTPAITLSTTVNGIAKGNGTALSAATAGTDYSAGTSGNSTGIVKSTTGTGALTTAVAGDFPTLNQNTSGNAATATALSTAGTTTTVLHGNASGAPSYGAVALGTDVSGTLAVAQFPALTGNVTTTAGSLVTTIGAAQVTNAMLAGSIDLTSKVTGILPQVNGGSGVGIAANGYQAMNFWNPGDVFLSPTASAADVQAAHDSIVALNIGTHQRGTVHLAPSTALTMSTGLNWETEYVNLDCRGSVLNFATAGTTTTYLNITNTLGIPENGSWITEGGRIDNCTIIGDPTQSGANYNTTTGIFEGGTPLLTETLNGTITPGASSLVISSATNFPTTKIAVQIDSEVMLLAAGSGTTRTITMRGYQVTTPASHTNGASIISLHNTNAILTNPNIHYTNKGFSIGDSAFASTIYDIFSGNNYYDVYAAAATNTNQAENIRFVNGNLNDCTSAVYAEQQILRFENISIDYCNFTMDLHLGSRAKLINSHLEFNYGTTAGQTQNPIKLTDADSTFTMIGGDIHYAGSTSTRYWTNNALIGTNNSTQHVTIENVECDHCGADVSDVTSDDALVTGSSANHNSTNVAQVSIRNLYTDLYSSNKDDLPSAMSYDTGANYWPNGPGFLYGEWQPRSVVTGGVTIANTASDGSVTPKDGDHMITVTAASAGHFYVTEQLSPRVKFPWSVFMNGLNGTGSVTVTAIYTTSNPVGNGSGGLTFTPDTRAQKSSSYTFPTQGTNQWTRVSCKNVENANIANFQNNYVTLDFDFTAAGGTWDLDQAAFGNF